MARCRYELLLQHWVDVGSRRHSRNLARMRFNSTSWVVVTLMRVFRRQPPLFLPETWNVFNATVSNTQRTNFETEAWNNAFARQIGQSHPSLYRLLDNLRKDTAVVHIALEAEARGQPPRKRVRPATRELQERLQNLCVARRDGSKSVAEALRRLGHTIRFVWVLKSTDVTWHRQKIRTFNVKSASSFVNCATYARYTRTSSLCTFLLCLLCV